MIFDGFGLPLGSPGEHFGGHLGARISHLTRLCQFFVFFWCLWKRSEKGAQRPPKRSLFRGGRHGASVVNSSKNFVFRVLEQAPFLDHFWHRFGLHFGSVLGAQVDTILRFGRPGVQIGCPEAVGWKRVCFVVSRVPKWSTKCDFGARCPTGETEVTTPDGLAREGVRYLTSCSCS